MGIEFDGTARAATPGGDPVIGSEFADVSVSIDERGNSPRLCVKDLRTGRVRYLDALELEAIVWLPDERLEELLDPSATRWRGDRA
jgi:hypothetical protein